MMQVHVNPFLGLDKKLPLSPPMLATLLFNEKYLSFKATCEGCLYEVGLILFSHWHESGATRLSNCSEKKGPLYPACPSQPLHPPGLSQTT